MNDCIVDEEMYKENISTARYYVDMVDIKEYDPTNYTIIYMGESLRIIDLTNRHINYTSFIDIYFQVSSIEGWFYELGQMIDITLSIELEKYFIILYNKIDSILAVYEINNICDKVVNGKISGVIHTSSKLLIPSYILEIRISK